MNGATTIFRTHPGWIGPVVACAAWLALGHTDLLHASPPQADPGLTISGAADGSGAAVISWFGEAGYSYDLLVGTNVSSVEACIAGFTNLFGAGAAMSYTNQPGAAAETMFYRLRFGPVTFHDDFTAYEKGDCFPDNTSFGPWLDAFGGFGCVMVATNSTRAWLDMAPQASTSTNETHACLVLGPAFTNHFILSVNLATASQLRQGSPPNPWEVAWVLWNYTDNTHFYYFIAKPDGWELGKEDPAYPFNQRFLATGSSPVFPIGPGYTVVVTEDGQNGVMIQVNGQPITAFTDTERPYASGRLGLYCEDAHVEFDGVGVKAFAQ